MIRLKMTSGSPVLACTLPVFRLLAQALSREQTRRCHAAKATCALGQIPPARRVVFQIRESRGRQVIDQHIAAAQCDDKVVQAGIVTDDHDARSGIWQAAHDFRQFGSIRTINCWFDRQRSLEIARGGCQFRCLQRPPRIRSNECIRHLHKRVQVVTNGRRVAASSVSQGAEAVTDGRIVLSLGVPQNQQFLDLDHPPFEAVSTTPAFVNEESEPTNDTGTCRLYHVVDLAEPYTAGNLVYWCRGAVIIT
jgi:hypothetical protein